MVRQWMMSIAESAMNKALHIHPESESLLRPLCGHVIRIKTHDPYLSFYLSFDHDGVQVLGFYDGLVSARVHGSASYFLRMLFSGSELRESPERHIRVIGDRALTANLFQLAQAWDFWDICRRLINEWLPKHEGFNDIVTVLKAYDPAWVERLQYLPQTMSQTLSELKQVNEVQQAQLQEIRQIKSMLEQQRKIHHFTLTVGVIFCLVAIGLSSEWASPILQEKNVMLGWVLGAVGIALVGPSLLATYSNKS